MKTGQVNPDRPLVGPSVDTFVGCFVGSPRRAENRKSALVGALVDALVGPLVGPLVGQISLSPALCVAHSYKPARFIQAEATVFTLKPLKKSFSTPESLGPQSRNSFRTPKKNDQEAIFLTICFFGGKVVQRWENVAGGYAVLCWIATWNEPKGSGNIAPSFGTVDNCSTKNDLCGLLTLRRQRCESTLNFTKKSRNFWCKI